MCFVELEKVFDRVPLGVLWRVLQEYGVSDPLIGAVRSLYDRCQSLVHITLLTLQTSSCTLCCTFRSATKNTLQIPRTKLRTMDDRAFSSAAPRLWNTSPTI